MKKSKILISLLLVICILFCASSTVFAEDYSGDEVYPGLSGILPGDTLTLPSNTVSASLPAVWGVRVYFFDSLGNEYGSVLVPVTDDRPGKTTLPEINVPGYDVKGWVRTDETAGTAILNPDGSTVPTDPKQHAPSEAVDVADQLIATVDYAYNAKGEKILGTWKFTPWDKDDFQIYEDTTITDGWTFKPAPPPAKYKYIVHYVLFDNIKTKVADDEIREIDSLGITVTEPAKTGNDLKAKYRKNYQPVPDYESVTA